MFYTSIRWIHEKHLLSCCHWKGGNNGLQAFDKKQYLPFIKEAYAKSDVIAFDLDERIDDDTRFAKGRFEFIAVC